MEGGGEEEFSGGRRWWVQNGFGSGQTKLSRKACSCRGKRESVGSLAGPRLARCDGGHLTARKARAFASCHHIDVNPAHHCYAQSRGPSPVAPPLVFSCSVFVYRRVSYLAREWVISSFPISYVDITSSSSSARPRLLPQTQPSLKFIFPLFFAPWPGEKPFCFFNPSPSCPLGPFVCRVALLEKAKNCMLLLFCFHLLLPFSTKPSPYVPDDGDKV